MKPEITAAHINSITQTVIGCAFKVIKTLGRGYLEKVYENALAHECRKAGLRVDQQHRIRVMYDGVEVGDYISDMVIEDLVLVEIKAAKSIEPAHEAQCLNYLTATRLPICLLLNFSSRVDVRRLVGPTAPVFPAYQPDSEPVPMTRAEQAEFADEPEPIPSPTINSKTL